MILNQTFTTNLFCASVCVSFNFFYSLFLICGCKANSLIYFFKKINNDKLIFEAYLYCHEKN